MSKDKLKFAVLGTGNSGQTFAADITLKGYSVNLAEVPEFSQNLEAIEKQGGIKLRGDAGEGFAKLNMITTDLKKAIKGVDVIFIGGSAYAHEPFCRSLLEDFEDGQFIVFTSNFAALRFNKWKKDAGLTTRVTPVESMSLLYATRAVAPGEVACIGVKNVLPVSALPASRTNEFLELIHPVFPQFQAADNVWFTSLNNLNPIVHPPMVLFNAGRIESTGGLGWNLYADGATESVARIMLAMDKERMALLEKIGSNGLAFEDAFNNLYQSYGVSRKSLSETLRQSPIHGNPAFPAPDRVNTRYINEDLPFGLAPWSRLGKAWNVPTPHVDAVVRIASTMTGVDYLAEGLTTRDLGVEGLSSDQARDLTA